MTVTSPCKTGVDNDYINAIRWSNHLDLVLDLMGTAKNYLEIRVGGQLKLCTVVECLKGSRFPFADYVTSWDG